MNPETNSAEGEVALPALVRFFDPSRHPADDERVIVHVPRLDRRDRDDGDGIYIGWYIASLNEWRIDGSPNEWEIDWWCRIPEPNVQGQTADTEGNNSKQI